MTVFTSRTGKITAGAASAAVLVILWKYLSVRINAEIILPPPERVLIRFLVIITQPGFWQAVGATCLRVVYGFTISFVSGFAAGLICGESRTADALLSPVISIIRTVPVMSVILLAMIWFRTDTVPVFVCFLMIFPITTTTVRQGILEVDPSLLQMARAFELERIEILRSITIPSVIPYVLAGIRSGIGVAWKSVIAAEVLCQPLKAVGTGLQFSQMNLETADVMAWTAAAVIMSRVSESLAEYEIKRRRWRNAK